MTAPPPILNTSWNSFISPFDNLSTRVFILYIPSILHPCLLYLSYSFLLTLPHWQVLLSLFPPPLFPLFHQSPSIPTGTFCSSFIPATKTLTSASSPLFTWKWQNSFSSYQSTSSPGKFEQVWMRCLGFLLLGFSMSREKAEWLKPFLFHGQGRSKHFVTTECCLRGAEDAPGNTDRNGWLSENKPVNYFVV